MARAIARAVQAPPTGPTADQTWRPGLMTVADLRRYRARERRPTRVAYRGFDVFSMAPPSSGGTTVGEALNILEQVQGYPGLSETERLHYFLEASRVAFADRGAYLGDPAFTQVPVRTLLSDAFAASRRATITEAAANATVPPATIGGPAGRGRAAINRPSQSTTHLTVADARGMVVSYTFTIESTGGNGIVVPGYGFLLNNELTDFTYNATTGPNRVEGGKRPRSSMAPTYIERQGRPFLAVGSPGGASIITTVLQTITNRIDGDRRLPGRDRAASREPAQRPDHPARARLPGPLRRRARGAALRPRLRAADAGAGRGHGDRVPPPRPPDRRRGARPPRGRERPDRRGLTLSGRTTCPR